MCFYNTIRSVSHTPTHLNWDSLVCRNANTCAPTWSTAGPLNRGLPYGGMNACGVYVTDVLPTTRKQGQQFQNLHTMIVPLPQLSSDLVTLTR